MITLTDEDAQFIKEQLHPQPVPLSEADQIAIGELLTYGSQPPADPDEITDRCTCNQPDTARDHSHQRGDLRVCRDAIDAAPDHVVPPAEASQGEADVGYPMTERCGCNHTDDTRPEFHRRGDPRVCRNAVNPQPGIDLDNRPTKDTRS